MDYIKARTYIDESHRFGGEMGLEAITCLLEKLGDPQETLQFIHIAGTNGKGSVGAYLAAVLQEAGYRIGRFISPTLYEYRERIQINGVYIEEEAFGRLMDPVVKAIGELEEEYHPQDIKTYLINSSRIIKENFLEHFSCTIHMQYKDTRGQKIMLFGALGLLERV